MQRFPDGVDIMFRLSREASKRLENKDDGAVPTTDAVSRMPLTTFKIGRHRFRHSKQGPEWAERPAVPQQSKPQSEFDNEETVCDRLSGVYSPS